MELKAKILRHKEVKYKYGRLTGGNLIEEDDLPSQLWNRALETSDLEMLLDNNNKSKLKDYELIKTTLDIYM